MSIDTIELSYGKNTELDDFLGDDIIEEQYFDPFIVRQLVNTVDSQLYYFNLPHTFRLDISDLYQIKRDISPIFFKYYDSANTWLLLNVAKGIKMKKLVLEWYIHESIKGFENEVKSYLLSRVEKIKTQCETKQEVNNIVK